MFKVGVLIFKVNSPQGVSPDADKNFMAQNHWKFYTLMSSDSDNKNYNDHIQTTIVI